MGTPNVFDTGVVLLRNTTWKCGKVERLVINYLRRRLQHRGSTQSSMKEMLEHFNSNGKQDCQVLDAMDRLETRGIIRIVTKPIVESVDNNDTETNDRGES